MGVGLRGLVSCVLTRHLKPWTRGRGWGIDGWVTVWWRRRNKREITLLSLLHFSLSPHPHAPRYSSSNYLKKDILFTFGPFSYSGCPAGKFDLSDQTGSRSAQHSNSLPSFLRISFLNKYKRHDSDYERKREWEKRGIVGEGQLISSNQGPTEDKEILFWRVNRV